jgi:hypothetical protein
MIDGPTLASRAASFLRSVPGRVLQRRAYWVDALGIVAALAYGWPSVAYRFGRDQALFFYIGREWLHGSVPYRDTFDLKPPGVYLLHSISIALLGPRQSSIRVFEVFGVVLLGVVAALAVRRSAPRVPGELGIGALLASGWYFTVFDYWDSGQVELWESLCLLGAYALLIQPGGASKRRLFWAGLLTGLAGLFKFTAAFPALGLTALAAGNGFWSGAPGLPRRALGLVKALVIFGLGVVSLWALSALYFVGAGASHAVGELLEYVAKYSKDYAIHGAGSGLIELFWFRQCGWWAALFAAAWIVGAGHAAARRDRGVLAGALSAAALFALSVSSVVIQGKFFLYHWIAMAGFFLALPLYAAKHLDSLPRVLRLVPALGLVAGAWLAAPSWYSNPAIDYRKFVTEIWWPAAQNPQLVNRIFVGPSQYNYGAQRAIADAIRARARPGDQLHVRGFELAIYAITGMRTPARFVSELPVQDRSLSTHPEKWEAEHEHAIWSVMPRFVVSFSDRHQDLAKIRGRGYQELMRAGIFVLFEKN